MDLSFIGLESYASPLVLEHAVTRIISSWEIQDLGADQSVTSNQPAGEHRKEGADSGLGAQ